MAGASTQQGKDNDNEDFPEKRRENLEPLPTVNDKNYPQEDRRYFGRKHYVRHDKYPLSSFVCVQEEEVDVDPLPSLPTFMGVFKYHKEMESQHQI